jgi:translocation and assembly module TamB
MAEGSVPLPRRRWPWRILALVAVVLPLVALLGLRWLSETPAGHAFAARQIEARFQPQSGLRVDIGRIEGSLLSDLALYDVTLRDPQGPFASAPTIRLSWNPVSALVGRWRIRSLLIPDARLDRLPTLNPTDPDEPLLPDIDLTLGRIGIDRLAIDKAVTGTAETLAIGGSADIRSGRLFTRLDASGTKGDRLALTLDSEPDRDRFDLKADIRAAKAGLFSGNLPQDLRLTISGEGGWARWRGVANAGLGTHSIATVGIALDAGKLGVTGDVRPAPFLDGAAARLLGTRVALSASIDLSTRRRSPFTLEATTDGLALSASGTLDRDDQHLEATRATADIANLAALDPQLSGGPLTLAATLEGPLRQPATTVEASAPALAWTTGSGSRYALVAPKASGRIAWDKPGPSVPFTLTAAGTQGLPETTAPLFNRPRLDGRLSLDNGLFRADALRLATPSLTATGTGTVRTATAAWTVTGTANLPAYALDGAGRFAVQTGFSARSLTDGTAAASGRATIQTLAFASAGARDVLGGLPKATLPWTWTERGNRLAVTGGSLSAPSLSASAIALAWSLDTNAFTLDATGRQRRAGAFTLAAGGKIDQPRATLRLPDPGVGLDLTSVVLEIAPESGGFRVAGTGRSAQGPASLDGFLEVAHGRPLGLRIDSAHLAGLTASGRVEQVPTGPFSGMFRIDGAGLDARVTLGAAGALQEIALTGTAAQSLLPLETPVRVGAADVDLTILLAEDGPRIAGTLRARNVSRGDLALTSLEASGRYGDDQGVGTVRLSGTAGGQPIAGTLSGTLVDGLYSLRVDSKLADVPVRSRGAIRLRRAGEGFELLPSALLVADGELRASGVQGSSPRLRLSATRLDLSILKPLGFDLPVRGTLDGDADLALGRTATFPDGRARLQVSVETPPSALGARPRIDLALDVVSNAGGLAAGARLTGSYGSSGRLVVRIAPGPGDTLAQRVLAGSLSGGIRYFGPADTAWSLLDVPDQQLSGSIGLAADFSGTLGEPTITGGLRGEDLTWRHLALGTRAEGLSIQGRFAGSDLEILTLDGRLGDGRISGRGRVRLSASASAVDIGLTLEKAKIADNPAYRIRVSGPVNLRGDLADLTVGGDLEVTDGELNIGRVTTAATTDVKVRRRGAPVPARTARDSRIGLDLSLRSADSIKVDGLGLDSFWGGRVRLGGDIRDPRLTGEVVAARGTYDFAGRSFDISRGRIGFTGDPWDSTILIQAVSLSDGFEAGVVIEGTARRPTIGFTSNPPLPDDEVLARLLFGTSVADLNVTEAVQLATALASLRGGGNGGIDPVGRLRRASGLDRIRLTGGDATTGMGSGIAIGERIGRNLYVEIATDTRGNALTNLQFTLTRVLSLLVEVTTLGDASANLRYARDY